MGGSAQDRRGDPTSLDPEPLLGKAGWLAAASQHREPTHTRDPPSPLGGPMGPAVAIQARLGEL